MSGRKERRAVHSDPYTFTSATSSAQRGEEDMPASLHALDFAYNDLKKRYNELNQKNTVLMKQLRQGTPSDDGAVSQQSPSASEATYMPTAVDTGALSAPPHPNMAKMQQENQSLRDMLKDMKDKQLDLELHNENMRQEMVLMKNSVRDTEEEKRLLLQQNTRLRQELVQSEEQKLNLLSGRQSGALENGKTTGAVGEDSDAGVAKSLRQLLALVAKQQQEVAALHQLANQQRNTIKHLLQESGPVSVIQQGSKRALTAPGILPTQCTDVTSHSLLTPSGAGHKEIHNNMVVAAALLETSTQFKLDENPTIDANGQVTMETFVADGEVETTCKKQPIYSDNDLTFDSPQVPQTEVRGQRASLSDDGRDETFSPPAYSSVTNTQNREPTFFNASEPSNAGISYPKRPLNYERNITPHASATGDINTAPSNQTANVNLNHPAPSGASAASVTVLNNNPLLGHKQIPQRNICPLQDDSSPGVEALSWQPRESADGSDEEPQVCPVCSTDFSPPLSLTDFQAHVLECLPSGDEPSSSTTGHQDSDDRVCPLCSAGFPARVPQADFLQHVDSHFEPDFHIVENVP